MKMFIGGEIEEDKRGNLAVVVAEDRSKQEYYTFLCEVQGDDYLAHTGVRRVSTPLVRLYSGVSREVATELLRSIPDTQSKSFDWKSIDQIVVTPYFLERSTEVTEKP